MADPTARIRKMQVRPSQSADLSFNMSGIIDRQNYDPASGNGPAHLGQSVSAFDIARTLYDHLGKTLPAVTSSGAPGFPREAGARLKYDSATIASTLGADAAAGTGPYLFALRNQALAASLDQMVNQRENAFLEKYEHAAGIQQAMQKAIPPIITHLQNMETLAQNRFAALDKAYGDAETAGRAPIVVKSDTTSTVSSDYKMTTKGTTTNTNIGMLNGPGSLLTDDFSDLSKTFAATLETDIKDATSADTTVQKQFASESASLSFIRDSSKKTWKFPDDNFVSQSDLSDTTQAGSSTATTPNQAFLHPRLDNAVANEQLQASLLGEEMNQTLASFRVPFMEKILANELASMDQEARKIQTNFVHTFLTSPLTGVVTIVYKDLGESVQAGEPVVRIENDDVVFVVGQVLFRDALRVGQSVTVHIGV
jgi:biotin carboxyl carrier protein